MHVTLLVSKCSPKEKPSGNLQQENISLISVTLLVSKLSPREKPSGNLHSENIYLVFMHPSGKLTDFPFPW